VLGADGDPRQLWQFGVQAPSSVRISLFSWAMNTFASRGLLSFS
jgi:hypothetical protein